MHFTTEPVLPPGAQDQDTLDATPTVVGTPPVPARAMPDLTELLGLAGLCSGEPCPAAVDGAHHLWLERQFQALHRRLDILDTLDQHAADLMFLIVSTQDVLPGTRREFSTSSRRSILAVVASPPYAGRCPACGVTPVLTRTGAPIPGRAEFDHYFHRGLNRPEHGWLICRTCHGTLHQGAYLARFARVGRFRLFQAAVIEHRRAQAQARRSGPASTDTDGGGISTSDTGM